MEADVTGAQQLKIVVSNWGDGFAYDRADMVNPVLIDEEGHETSLTTLSHSSYTSEWGTLHINQNVEGKTLKVNNQSYTTGLGMNAQCTLIYDLPAGHNYKTFRALCGYDSSCDTDNTSSTGTTMEFIFYVKGQNEEHAVDLTQFGYKADEDVPLYDIWAKKDMGTVKGTLRAKVSSHGAKLFRLGNNTATGIQQTNIQTNGRQPSTANHYYDLQGRMLNGQLMKGLYIRNGKKYLAE
jgi:hypothetical protein